MAEQTARKALRKTRTGRVLSNGMDKSLVVLIESKRQHPLYGKTVTHRKKLYVHDEKNEAKVGDVVEVTETRPISRLKRWRLVRIIRPADAVEA